MPDIGGTGQMIGELGGLFEDIKKTVAEAKAGVAAAASELVTEVRAMKNVETAIRAQTASVRSFNTSLLGNATGGENEGGAA